MRKLCEKITDELAGLSVESGLKRCFFMSNDHISRLKRRPEGITLNGKKAYGYFIGWRHALRRDMRWGDGASNAHGYAARGAL